MNRYRLYGLDVHASFPLSANQGSAAFPDVAIELIDVENIPATPAAGRLLSAADPEGPSGQSLTDDSGKFTLRFNGLAEFVWRLGEPQVLCRLARGNDPDWAGVLAASSFLSVWLALTGKVSLHAGVVDLDGRAFAFAGHSNQGKTTLSYGACLAGARLLSDDVLVTHRVDGRFLALAGNLQLRLREEAEAPPNAIVQRSADQRLCFRFKDAPDHTPLVAIIIPVISTQSIEPSLEALGGVEAFRQLAQFPRTLGQSMPDYRAACFREYAELASAVPVFLAHLPRGFQRDAAFPRCVSRWLEDIHGA